MADPSMSQTAHDYIATQLGLEADAREALPYQFDACTKPLGPLRQAVLACLTCTPPPASPHQQFTPAGICYSCSISCHGAHDLVELFTKRDFVCDCGTTRMGNGGTPCSLRVSAETGRKGGVRGEEARAGNRYNWNFEGRFCGCGERYDPEVEKGTMFQCLGLGGVGEGGCGEDWWHAECLMGLPRGGGEGKGTAVQVQGERTKGEEGEDGSEQGAIAGATTEEEILDDDAPLPPGFPDEDAFDHLICYKCVAAFPWIKQYAGTPGFLPAVSADGSNGHTLASPPTAESDISGSKKRRADDEAEGSHAGVKKARAEPERSGTDQAAIGAAQTTAAAAHTSEESPAITDPTPRTLDPAAPTPTTTTLPPAPPGPTTLFLTPTFRANLCRCPTCFPLLAPHRALLEEEELPYEPPLSSTTPSSPNNDTHSLHSTTSLLERGEAALSGMDRVRAIEGVMAYNHVRDKVKAFLLPFAESGRVVGAEDIRAYFAGLRGDDDGEAGVGG
ncbi:hypothetical protein LTR08_000641 [Meristemomyces frigidus]|nr:hypothetical protein LTR08_000641 [Meristemomyces frigidus]